MSAGPAVLCVAVDFGWPLEAITVTEERNTAGRLLLLGIEKERSVLVLAWLLLVVRSECEHGHRLDARSGAKAVVHGPMRRRRRGTSLFSLRRTSPPGGIRGRSSPTSQRRARYSQHTEARRRRTDRCSLLALRCGMAQGRSSTRRDSARSHPSRVSCVCTLPGIDMCVGGGDN